MFVTPGHQWKRGQWTKDEVDRLQSNIMAYCQAWHTNIVANCQLFDRSTAD